MKSKIAIFVTTLLILNSFFLIHNCMCQWVWLNPLPHGSKVNNINFINQYTGWAISYNSNLLKTTNEGINWFKTDLNIYTKLNVIKIYKSTNGDHSIWIGGGLGNLFRSTNFGNTWENIYAGINKDILDLWILNHDEILLTLKDGPGNFIKTTNAGANWTTMNLGNAAPSNYYFINNLTGWLFQYWTGANHTFTYSQQFGYKTTNGGSSWEQIYDMYFSGEWKVIWNIHFKNNSTGFLYGNNYSKVTSNGGFNWNTPPVSLGGYSFYLDTVNGYLYNGKTIYRTNNYGTNWELRNANTNFGISSFHSTGNNVIYSGSDFGRLYKSTDDGITFSKVLPYYSFTNSNINIIYSSDSNTVYAVNDSCKLFKSNNGGYNWSAIHTFSQYSPTCMSFSNSNTGFAGSIYGRLFKTINGGYNWTYFPSFNAAIRYVKVFNSGIGYLLTDNGFFKTTNMGETWFNLYITNKRIYSISFPDENTGYAVDSLRTFKTSNGGENWSQLKAFVNGQYNQYIYYNYLIQFINQNYGISFYNRYKPPSNPFGYGSENSFHFEETTNGGLNWNTVNVGLPIFCRSVNASNGNYSFVSGNKIYKKINTSWDSYELCEYTLNSITGAGNYLWVAGDSGIVAKGISSPSVEIKEISSEIPTAFSLSQNFPNPFNPTTKIKFNVPLCHSEVGESFGIPIYRDRNPLVVLKVFDILGKEVATLVNESLQPGTYETTFDASNLSSGIYFYQLRSNNFIQTKKLTLIK